CAKIKFKNGLASRALVSKVAETHPETSQRKTVEPIAVSCPSRRGPFDAPGFDRSPAATTSYFYCLIAGRKCQEIAAAAAAIKSCLARALPPIDRPREHNGVSLRRAPNKAGQKAGAGAEKEQKKDV
uniref:PID domain-containing protein n=1 Tax=Steinernema glaseri TaxID=37863 RepID=A0A1I8A9Z0_9BILA